MSRWSWVSLLLVGCGLGLAEYGGVGDGPGLGDRPVPARVWRLTAAEYRASVADLLGADVLEAEQRTISDGQDDHGFTNGAASLGVRFEEATDFLYAAEVYAAAARSRFDALCSCDPSADECAASCIETLAERAYRRPLTEEDRARLHATVESGSEPSVEDGLELGVASLLVSPHFLYRSELGDPASQTPDGLRTLTPHEIASALSYLVTGGPPDDALRAAAADGTLLDGDVRAAHLERLYPRSGDRLAEFVRRWLGVHDVGTIDKQRDLYPTYGEALLREMVAETETYVRNHLVAGDRQFVTLMESEQTWVGPQVADLYGVTPDPSGEAWLDPSQRAGVLTQPLVLTVHSTYDSSAPVYRGAFVWHHLFCETFPPPPAEAVDAGRDALADLDPPPPTTRERTEIMTAGPTCVGCHDQINPIGFAFEHYDAIGAYRTSENGTPIDASGELPDTLDVGGPVDDAVDVALLLSQSEEVQRCFLRRLAQYSLGVDPGPVDESAWMSHVSDAFREANTDLRATLMALVRDERFVLRHVDPEGVSP